MNTESLLRRAYERELRPRPAIRGLAARGWLERARILKALDLMALDGAIALGFVLSGEGAAILAEFPLVLLSVAALNFLWLLLAETFDQYQPTVTHKSTTAAWGALLITLTLCALPLIPVLALTSQPWHRVSLTAAGWALILVPLVRALIADGLAAMPKRRALLATSREAAMAISGLIPEGGGPDIELLGYVDGGAPLGGETGVELDYLGAISGLRRALDSHAPNVVAVEPRALQEHGDEGDIQALLDHDVEVVPVADFYGEISGRIPVGLLSEKELSGLMKGRRGDARAFEIASRIVDLCWALIGLAGLSLAFPFIALAIYLDSPGPIFYTQTRIGKGGKPFKAFKFRSMVPEAENGMAKWAHENDGRITRVGRLLRKTHLDEFPQFINILKGEMSPVGPRPERPVFVDKFRAEIPHYDARHLVRPGMAGWGLVNMGYAASEEDARQKHEYDLYYIQHQSLWFDLVILMKTVVDTVTLGGR